MRSTQCIKRTSMVCFGGFLEKCIGGIVCSYARKQDFNAQSQYNKMVLVVTVSRVIYSKK